MYAAKCLAAASLLAATMLAGCSREPESKPVASTAPVEKAVAVWPAFVDSFIEARFKADPYFAVQAGRHEFDGKMPDWSRAAFDSDSASRFADGGEPVILVRPDTTTADVAGFATAAGIVTAVGGRTAHAALVARQMGKPCIVGCTALSVEPAAHAAQLAGTAIGEGDWLSIDGEAGAIYLGRGDVVTERPEAELAEVERWRAAAA